MYFCIILVGILNYFHPCPNLLKNQKHYIRKFTVSPFSPDRRVCEPCPNEKDIVNTNGECETCQEGSFPNGERNSCSECKPNEIVNFDGSCNGCPDGFIPNENRRFCYRCPKSLIANGGVCTPCPNPEKE